VFGDDLRIEARIENVGVRETPLQLAIHSYWACDDPARVTVHGLGDRYLDNLSALAERRETDSSAPHAPPFDRVYPDSAADLELGTERYRLEVRTRGGAGAVLWNPGPDHSIADLGVPSFVCLENGVVLPPLILAPREAYELEVSYRVNTRA
jgi:D-hexose-6-phosphate mutarotase